MARIDGIVDRAAQAIINVMFAPHELPLSSELIERYRDCARAALGVILRDLALMPCGSCKDDNPDCEECWGTGFVTL